MSAAAYIDEDRAFISQTSTDVFTRERVLAGDCRVLEKVAQANIRQEVASYFGIHTSCVVVVGSSKLGYSISPNKTFKAFDDSSDIDVAVVEPKLFESYWLQMYKAKEDLVDWPDLSSARKYLFRGWIRPDKLPLLDIRNKWFDFFNDLQARNIGGQYAVRGGLYYNYNFLESYHLRSVQNAFPET